MLTERYNNILQFINDNGGITIDQASKLFFNCKYGKDTARKRLKILSENKYIKYGEDWATNQRVYYKEKNLPAIK